MQNKSVFFLFLYLFYRILNTEQVVIKKYKFNMRDAYIIMSE